MAKFREPHWVWVFGKSFTCGRGFACWAGLGAGAVAGAVGAGATLRLPEMVCFVRHSGAGAGTAYREGGHKDNSENRIFLGLDLNLNDLFDLKKIPKKNTSKKNRPAHGIKMRSFKNLSYV